MRNIELVANILDAIALNVGIIAMCGLVVALVYYTIRLMWETIHHYVWCWYKVRQLRILEKQWPAWARDPESSYHKTVVADYKRGCVKTYLKRKETE